jgi:hypothetical protein
MRAGCRLKDNGLANEFSAANTANLAGGRSNRVGRDAVNCDTGVRVLDGSGSVPDDRTRTFRREQDGLHHRLPLEPPNSVQLFRQFFSLRD